MCCVFCAFLILLILHSLQLVCCMELLYCMRREGAAVIVSMCSADLLN